MAALTPKQIERGSVSLTGAETNDLVTITLTTTLTDIAKTVLLFSTRTGSINARDYLIVGRVISTTQIQFERDLVVTSSAVIEYQVIEFTQGITVQHLNINTTSATTDTTITAVTLANTFVIATSRHSGNNFDETDTGVVELTSTTNLQIRSSGFSGKYMGVQVIQIDDASVQVFVTTFGTGSTKDITVTTIDPAKTFWLFSLEYPATAAVDVYGDDIPYMSYVDTTTLRLTRVASTSIDYDIVAYVVSLSSGISVQNVTTTIASSGNTVSPTIPNAITVENTALLNNGYFQSLGSTSDTTDDGGNFAITLSGLTTTQFTATRADSNAFSATTNVQVLSFFSTYINIILIEEFL